MNDAQYDAIKRRLEDTAVRDIHMNAQTWEEFKHLHWPGHAKIPPGPVRVWVAAKRLQGRKFVETVPDGLCQAGIPDTGNRVR